MSALGVRSTKPVISPELWMKESAPSVSIASPVPAEMSPELLIVAEVQL